MESTTEVRTSKGIGLPKVVELGSWSEEQFLDFFTFASTFMEKLPTGLWKWTVNKVTIGKANAYLDSEDANPMSYWTRRIGEISSDRYSPKLRKAVGTVCSYLKRNPAFITEKIRSAIDGNPHLDWCLKTYEVATTDGGEKIVAPYIGTGKLQIGTIRGKEVELLLMEAQLKIVDMYHRLTKSISPKDLDALSTEKKLQWIKELSPILKQNRIIRPTNVNVFNMNKKSAEDLERSLLDYSIGKTKDE